MINKSFVRTSNKARFKKCLSLRKQGHSYGEISQSTGTAKSTLNNWFTLAGLTLTKQHLEIQLEKRVEKRRAATEASKITRARRKNSSIQNTTLRLRRYFNDPLFLTGIALYEAEGTKKDSARFSNSDYRLIETFVRFIETYFNLNRESHMSFSLYLHKTRKEDLGRIKRYWAKQISISQEKINIYWKLHQITRRRKNLNYVGQMLVTISGESYLTSKLLAISDIILKQHIRN